jgi:hypothetical protein
MGQPYEKASTLSKKEIVFNNFLGGIFWSLGATIGLALIFTILTLIAKSVDLVPFVGEFVSDIIDFVMSRNANLR